jgi:hypothetical protein
MGWFSNIWKKVKNVFKKVSKVVKKIVKSVGKVAKKVWNGVKSTAQKFAKGISKLGPFANIAMNFIPGFGQLWAAYGIWGQIAKGALVGFATTGKASGSLLGAVIGGLGHVWKNIPGETIFEKVGGLFDDWKNDSAIGKAIGNAISDIGNFETGGSGTVAGPDIFDRQRKIDMYDRSKLNPISYGLQSDYEQVMADTYANVKVGENLLGSSKYGYTGTGAQSMAGGSSWVDKLRQGTQAYSLLNQQPQNQFQLPYNPYDTSQLAGYDTTAGSGQGQISGGQDTFDVTKIGLLTALQRMQESQGVFLKPNYS